jgi:glycolate oxidase iron-sulfur subunit
MQTTFTPEQLSDPATAEANGILRSCVHCGFCTATCPTYLVLGDELDSPRGRIYLMKEMLESNRDPDPATVKHIDRCLSCLACMTTCPSGVHYRHLVDHARAYIEARYKRPLMDRLLRRTLAMILPHPRRFRLALLAAKVGRPFAPLLPDARLRAMLRMAPKSIPPVSRAEDPRPIRRKGAQAPRGAAHGMRPARSRSGHQRGRDPPPHPHGRRGRDPQGPGLLRGADAPHGTRGPGPRHGRRQRARLRGPSTRASRWTTSL